MWVQEGNDCKDGDEDEDLRRPQSLIEKILYSRRSHKEQSVSRVAIPMLSAKTKSVEQTALNSKTTSLGDSDDQKDGEEFDPERRVSPLPTPYSEPPARRSTTPKESESQVLNTTAEKRSIEKAVPMESVDNEQKDEDEDFSQSLARLNSAIGNEQSTFTRLVDAMELVDKSESEYSAEELHVTTIPNFDESDGSCAVELATTQIEEPQSKVKVEDDDEEAVVSVDEVVQWTDWEKCMAFTNNGGLVVAEVYSVVFGPCMAMAPCIVEMIRKEHAERNVQFVRLSLHRLNTIELIREAIVDYDRYYPTPVPLFLFLKNGKKVGQLQGTQLSELSELITKYYDGAQTVPAKEVSVKYTSILAPKGFSSRGSCRGSAVSWCDGIKENITHLIERVGLDDTSQGPGTKLWKNEMILVD